MISSCQAKITESRTQCFEFAMQRKLPVKGQPLYFMLLTQIILKEK